MMFCGHHQNQNEYEDENDNDKLSLSIAEKLVAVDDEEAGVCNKDDSTSVVFPLKKRTKHTVRIIRILNKTFL